MLVGVRLFNLASFGAFKGAVITTTVLVACGGHQSGDDDHDNGGSSGTSATAGGSGMRDVGGTPGSGARAGAGAGGGTGAAPGVGGSVTGGSSALGGMAPTAGTAGVGGTSAGKPGTGGMAGAGTNGGSGSSLSDCRTYAASYVIDFSTGSKLAYTCTHDENSGFNLSCVQDASITQIRHWATKADFIDETAALGTTKVLTSVQVSPASTTVYAYDAATGHLLTITVDGNLYTTYDSWDDLGRPRHGVMGTGCDNAEVTWTYTDRTSVEDIPTGACKYRFTFTYDDDLLPTHLDYGNGTSAEYVTSTRTKICR